MLAAGGDAQVREQVDTETRLFDSRRLALKNELAALDAAMKAQDEAAAGYAAQLAARKRQQAWRRRSATASTSWCRKATRRATSCWSWNA